MSNFDDEPEDRLLGRLHEATGSDAALRRLRRRYDQLREDYEALLDRLGELEEQIEQGGEDDDASERRPAPARDWLSDLLPQLVAPLTQLREQYEAAVAGLQSIVDGLGGLAAGGMKGQHEVPPGRAAPARPQPGPARPRQLQVEVKGKGFGELLDFQERISGIEGVARVSIHGIDSERATFIVELADE